MDVAYAGLWRDGHVGWMFSGWAGFELLSFSVKAKAKCGVSPLRSSQVRELLP
jgi:hypothetical protein